MSNRVCFTLPSTGECICIDIPLLIKRNWRRPIPPEQRVAVEGPLPDPWIQSHGLRPEVAIDMQVLASIHALAKHLSDGSRTAVQELVQAQVGKLQLPKELQFHLER